MKLRYVAFATSVLAIGIGTAWAANPHFLYANPSIDAQGYLQLSFKEVGLGNPSGETGYCLGTDKFGADSQCRLGDGNPIVRVRTIACVDQQTGQCSNLHSLQDLGAQFFHFDINGQNTQTLNPTEYRESRPQPEKLCKIGSNRTLIKVRYSNIDLTDISNNVVANVNPTMVELPLYECPPSP